MPIFAKPTPRQKEIRRSKAERRPVWYRRLTEHLPLRGLAVLLLCGVLGALLVNLGGEQMGLQVGYRVPRAITSRVDFRVADELRTRDMKTRARDNAENYYTLDTSLLQDIQNRFTQGLRMAREHAGDLERLRQRAAEIQFVLDETGSAELARIVNEDESSLYEHAVERMIQSLRRQPLVEATELALRRTGEKAVLVDPAQETERSVSILRLRFANDLEAVQTVAAEAAGEFPTVLQPSIKQSLVRILKTDTPEAFRPLYRYDTTRSTQAAQAAADAVPTQYDEYVRGTTLADAGAISRDERELLETEHTVYHERLRLAASHRTLPDPPRPLNEDIARERENIQRLHTEARQHTLALIARGLIAFLVIFGLGGYIVLHYNHDLGSIRRRVATLIALLLVVALARATYLYTPTPYLAVGAYALGVALLTVTSVRGVATIASALLALVVALATDQGIAFVVVLVATALVMLFGLQNIRKRGRIIGVGALAAVVAGLASLLAGLLDGQTLSYVLNLYALWAALTTLAAAFLLEGTLPIIEHLFGVTTAMTLLEWCDPSKPLLRMLAAESPGTYNHSLLVGTLADAAAQAIGTDGLLARTGAYYHDIGKINKPGYFVENQGMDVGNRHERLSPAMSHLIIIGHVKDGIEMAKEYGLPAALHSFIPEHHGTCVVEYFYHAANQARKPGDPEVSDSEFRYPGPRPRSKETAIVMMCDAVEGAVRAMPEPTPNRIEDTVERMIQKRLMDGQFDECDLTFRELEDIRKSLVKSLNSIHHGRISYPSSDKSTESRAS